METSIVCRACLTTISLEYIDLETPLYDKTFLDCFNICTKLQASLEDAFSNNICVPCGRSLHIAYDFIKASTDADRVLRDSLFLGEIEPFQENKHQPTDIELIVKKEEDNEELEYQAEYVEEYTEEMEFINLNTMKVEQVQELPEFEVVMSSVQMEDNVEEWLPVEDEKNNWADLSLDDENDFKKDEYEDHTNTDTGDSTFKCDKCDEQFVSSKGMESHKKLKHSNVRKRENFFCGWCGEAFSGRCNLLQHRLNDHKGKVPDSCLTCGEKFSDEASLVRHVKKAHGIQRKPVPCPYCHKEFKGISLHIKSIHPDILRIPIPEDGGVKLAKNQCPYCFRYCQSKNILNDHLNTHTGERPYSCTECDKTFHKKSILDRHEFAVHKSKDAPKQKCHLCNFSTSNILSLRSHIHRHRRPIEKKYLCSFCPVAFVNPKKLRMHEDFHHGNMEKQHQCEICKKKFLLERKLRDHMMCVHVIGRPHECAECNKTFKNDFQLKAHLKLHSGKLIDCTQCEKKFARQIDFRIHMRTHTGELPYECHLCDKRYAIKVRLTYHLQKHMGIKHKCPHCPSEYNSRAKLRLHMFKHIGMPYVCDHCQMGYPNRVGLRRHVKSTHKIILTDEDLQENRRKNEQNINEAYRSTPAEQPLSKVKDDIEIE